LAEWISEALGPLLGFIVLFGLGLAVGVLGNRGAGAVLRGPLKVPAAAAAEGAVYHAM
jgi:hypothetical protein